MIVAIDGPSASGKGTLARRIAERFDLEHLDTGKIYRAIGLAVARAGGDPADKAAALEAAKALDPASLDDPALGGDEAAQAASLVAAMQPVRDQVLDFQRQFADHPPGGAAGAVLDGRDIGTVVCPAAHVKLFVVARDEVRAERRHKELLERGEAPIYARVLQEMRERDARDTKRDVAPLRPAEDAFVLDTSDLDADAAFAAALEFIEAR